MGLINLQRMRGTFLPTDLEISVGGCLTLWLGAYGSRVDYGEGLG